MNAGKTYKSWWAWLLLLTYFLSTFKTYQPFVNYQVNYRYISNVLCVNKERPAAGCHGKCYLTKELKKTAEEESKKSTSARTIQTEQIFTEKYCSFAPAFFLIIDKSYAAYSMQEYLVTEDISSPPPRV